MAIYDRSARLAGEHGGTIGVRGVNADIDIGVDQILQHLDMIFAIRAEAQKGPFGILR